MMMKKFIFATSLQPGAFEAFHYRAVGNDLLEMPAEAKVHYPILTAVSGYVEEGEEFEVVEVITDTKATQKNHQIFVEELSALCACKKNRCKAHHEIVIPDDERVTVQLDTFQKLIDKVADDDELFACLTYGSKPLVTAIKMAVQYAYRVLNNASIRCIVYGKIYWPASAGKADVVDMTALIQLDEIVRVLANQHLSNPKEVISRILSL